jgi:integrase
VGRKRTQGSGSIIARANGRFTAQISDTATGRRRSVGTFTTKAAAEKAIAHAIVEGPPPTLEVTFGAYLTEWLEDQALVVKATTAAKNRAMVRRVLREPVSRRKVRDLKPEDFRRLYRELRDHGKADGTPLAASSVKTLDQVLKSALQQLVDDCALRFHPIPRRVVAVQRTERPWLNLDQVRELVRFARFAAPDLEVVVRLGALAGLRRGEICGLRWTDVDLDSGSLTIRRNRVVASGQISETTPKTTGSAATISLDDATLSTLRRHHDRRAGLIEQAVPDAEYVVCTATGTGSDPNNLSRGFRQLVDQYNAVYPEAQLPDAIGLHTLRHSFASGLVARGVNLKIAATAMRHSSVRMMDRYGHLAPSTVDEAVRALAEEVGT